MGFFSSCSKWLLFVSNFLVFVSIFYLLFQHGIILPISRFSPVLALVWEYGFLWTSHPLQIYLSRQKCAMNLNRKYSLSLSLSSLDGPHHSYLQQHRHPHTHRGRWFHPDQFLRLLWSLQRESVYDRNGESDIQFSNMKLNIALCVSSVFRRFVCSDDSGPCWSNRCHDPGENTRTGSQIEIIKILKGN